MSRLPLSEPSLPFPAALCTPTATEGGGGGTDAGGGGGGGGVAGGGGAIPDR